jgi:hypothetical protein
MLGTVEESDHILHVLAQVDTGLNPPGGGGGLLDPVYISFDIRSLRSLLTSTSANAQQLSCKFAYLVNSPATLYLKLLYTNKY